MSRKSELKIDIPFHLKTSNALCKGFPTRVFIPEIYSGMTKDQRDRKEAQGKAICALCPVKITCLNYALTDSDIVGVWGGTNEIERDKIRKELRPLRLVTDN